MRLLCPYCQKAITVSDSEAGKAVNCPECNQQFAAPQLYTPAPAPAVPPPPAAPVPPPVPETYVKESADVVPPLEPPKLPEMPPPDRELSGFAHILSAPLEPHVIRWIPAGALFLVFILTFFSWNGLYPAGYAAFTQNAWDGLFASMNRDPVANDELRVGDKKLGDELESRLHTTWWLLPYLLFLFPALALAVAGPFMDLTKLKLPPAFANIWKFRPLGLGVFVIMVLLFLLAQWANGFGLQRAVNDLIEAEFAAKKAEANTPEKMQRWEMNVAAVKGAFHVKTTPWLRLAVLLHLLAAVAVAAEAGLLLRGKKPAPRAAVMW
jgi:predicted Zn finger-like uncharacterized protein